MKPSTRSWLLMTMLALACTPEAGDLGATESASSGGSSEDDGVGTQAGESETSGAEADGAASTDGSDGGETGDAVSCPAVDGWACSIPVECGKDGIDHCGGWGPFDDNGCLRPRCDDDSDCGGDESCVRSPCSQYIGCSDANSPGECTCLIQDGCYDHGFCVDEEAENTASVGGCEARSTEADCQAMAPNAVEDGICVWVQGYTLPSFPDLTCEDYLPLQRCTYMTGASATECDPAAYCIEGQRAYWRKYLGETSVIYNPLCGPEPEVGYARCEGHIEEPPCQCLCE